MNNAYNTCNSCFVRFVFIICMVQVYKSQYLCTELIINTIIITIMKTNNIKVLALLAMMTAGMTMTTSCSSDNDNVVENNVETSRNKAKEKSDSVSFKGNVASVSSYGEMELGFRTADLNKVGIEYGDLVDVTVGDDIVLHDVPYVTSFNEVALYSPCLCDYNATGQTLSLGMGNGDFSVRIGGKPNDAVTITLKSKGGYKEMQQLLKSSYGYDRYEYESDEMFANFREMTTSGMAPRTCYRSGNPLNCVDNKVRYAYVDRLAAQAGIKTEIDLADTPEKIAKYRSTEGYESTYCLALYDHEQTVTLGLTADAFSDKFMTKLADGLRFMANHDAPYLIHCNEGKDRCGFVSMLLQSLAGASYEEVAADYMVTFYNLCHTQIGTDSYNLRKKYSIDRMVWLMSHLDDAAHPTTIDWSNIAPDKVDLHAAARNYIMHCGVSESDCNKLESKLRGM